MASSTESRIRVLLAGREGAVASFHEALAAAGMEIVGSCATPAQVIAQLSSVRPDVCVVDRELVQGGLVATAAIAAPRRPVRVLVVGGNGSAAEERAAQLAGASRSLPGDVDAGSLIDAVSELAHEAAAQGSHGQ